VHPTGWELVWSLGSRRSLGSKRCFVQEWLVVLIVVDQSARLEWRANDQASPETACWRYEPLVAAAQRPHFAVYLTK